MRPTLLLAILATASSVLAADAPPPLQMHRTSAPITLDGDLNDAGWRDAAIIDRFYETAPADNTEPKVKTIAYVTYDDRNFYIGVRAFDPDPSKIRAPFVERDAVIGTDDNIAVFLDTRNDKRSGIELRVNPRGIQGDAIYNDANGNEDFSPDFFYDTAAKIDAEGWAAEYRIPFTSLRFPKADPQTWNILIWRNYPRDYRYFIQSAPIPRGSNCYMCHMHPLVGLTGLPDAGHLVAAPYVTAQRLERPVGGLGTPLQADDAKLQTGIDVKWNPSARGAVDLTINPDFSQVEADVAQITVNQRFAVFVPEKRPFFLEGFDLFDTPLQVAYTRTINSPRWGVRGTGKIGGSAYTFLVTQDRGGGLTILPGPLGNDFALQDSRSYAAIGRVRHDIGSSFVGAVLTDREIRGGGYNRLLGPDFQWRPTESEALTGQLLASQTEDRGAKTTSHAFTMRWNHFVTKNDGFFRVSDVGDDFRADLGFIPQAGYREAVAEGGWHWWPQDRFFSYVRVSGGGTYQQDQHRTTILRDPYLGANFIGRKNLQSFATFHLNEEIFVRDGLLSQTHLFFFAQFDPSRRLPRITASIDGGEQIDFSNARVGHGATVNLSTILRPDPRLDLELTANRQWLDRDGGRVFTAQVERLRATYSFTAKSIVRVIGQYVSTERNPALYSFGVDRHQGSFLASVLYSYKLNWQTVLFAGYGDDRLLTPANDLVKADRSLFFKVSYALQR
ncbi:MAG TPA: DUF5916 domain-containing protein [Thermoanaerobaculia bacterium]|nr:DUF5916 domain-containing protein [Thermoanaerobaculia bacterium]